MNILLQLLDLWGLDLSGLIKVGPKMKKIVEQFSACDDVKERATILNTVAIEFGASSYNVLQAVEAQLLPPLVTSCINRKHRKLAQVAIQQLTKIADFRHGTATLLKYVNNEYLLIYFFRSEQNVIGHFIKVLNFGVPTVFTLQILRFLEILCQYPEAAQRFEQESGPQSVYTLLSQNYNLPLMSNLCIMCIRVFHNLIRTLSTVGNLDSNSKIMPWLEKMSTLPASKSTKQNQRLSQFTAPIEPIVKQQLVMAIQNCLVLTKITIKTEADENSNSPKPSPQPQDSPTKLLDEEEPEVEEHGDDYENEFVQ